MFAWIKMPHVPSHCSLFHSHSTLLLNIYLALIQYLFHIFSSAILWNGGNFNHEFHLRQHKFPFLFFFPLKEKKKESSDVHFWSLFRIPGMSQHGQVFVLRGQVSMLAVLLISPSDWLHLLTSWHDCCAEWMLSIRMTLSPSHLFALIEDAAQCGWAPP